MQSTMLTASMCGLLLALTGSPVFADSHQHDEHDHAEHAKDEAKHDKHDGHNHDEHAKNEVLHAEHEGHDHEATEQHAAHQHGVARLTIAVAEQALSIELDSPAANILGFEHAASSDADKKTLSDAVTTLKNASALFSMPVKAGCELQEANVESALLQADATEKADANHNDIRVQWNFTCSDSAELKGVNTHLFRTFPEGLQHLKVDWITATKASSVELATDDTISLQ